MFLMYSSGINKHTQLFILLIQHILLNLILYAKANSKKFQLNNREQKRIDVDFITSISSNSCFSHKFFAFYPALLQWIKQVCHKFE